MIGLSRLKADVAKLVAPRGGGRHPTVARLLFRNQRFLVDLGDSGGIIPDDFWQPMDPGEAGTPARAAFDLCLEYSEEKIWPAADKVGLTAALVELLGRGPMSAAELAEAELELAHPLTREEFCKRFAPVAVADDAVGAAVPEMTTDELRQEVIAIAAAAGEPCPLWLDRLQDDLTAEELAEIEAWLTAHVSPVGAAPVEQEAPPAEPGDPEPEGALL